MSNLLLSIVSKLGEESRKAGNTVCYEYCNSMIELYQTLEKIQDMYEKEEGECPEVLLAGISSFTRLTLAGAISKIEDKYGVRVILVRSLPSNYLGFESQKLKLGETLERS